MNPKRVLTIVAVTSGLTLIVAFSLMLSTQSGLQIDRTQATSAPTRYIESTRRPTVAPTATLKPIPTATATLTPTLTLTPSPSSTPTSTATPTWTPTKKPTLKPTAKPTRTPAPPTLAPPTALPLPTQPSYPSGATAICNDGTYSFSQHRRGTCSHHGGVRQWLVNLPP